MPTTKLACAECAAPIQPHELFETAAPHKYEFICEEHKHLPADYRQPLLTFTPSPTFDRNTSRRFVGCELEMYHQSEDMDVMEDYCIDWRLYNAGMSEDGSIDHDAGIETKTPPANGDLLLDWVTASAKIATQYGMTVNQSCGFHVHVDLRDFAPNDIRALLKLGRAIEPVFYAMLPRARRGHYSKPMALTFPDIHSAEPTQNSIARTWQMDKNDRGDRYRGLNLAAYYQHKTIEFRYHSGTLNPTKIKNWIKLCTAVVDTAKARGYSKIPWRFKDFWHRTNTLLDTIGCADLLPYVKKRVEFFQHDLNELHELNFQQPELSMPESLWRNYAPVEAPGFTVRLQPTDDIERNENLSRQLREYAAAFDQSQFVRHLESVFLPDTAQPQPEPNDLESF